MENLQELNIEEQKMINGGGDGDDLAYNIVYFGLTSNPFFWKAKFDTWLLSQIL
ncbi:MAG: hypothetical protein L3J74_12735 [Bacteroidales bacterium]|nr:hypothetical protein [Bacteroidales bacterium]